MLRPDRYRISNAAAANVRDAGPPSHTNTAISLAGGKQRYMMEHVKHEDVTDAKNVADVEGVEI